MLISGQPIEIAIGPPLFQACPYVVKQPARIEMIVNEIAKLENPLQPAVQLLLVAKLCEALLVGGQGPGCAHLLSPLEEKRFDRPSFDRDNKRDRGRKSRATIQIAKAAGQLANARPPGSPARPAISRRAAARRGRARCPAGARSSRSRRAQRVALAHGREQPAVLRVGGGEHLRRMRDVGDQVGHRALHLGHRAHQARGAGGFGEPDVQADVGLAVGGEVLQRVLQRGGQLVERERGPPAARVRRRAPPRRARPPGADRRSRASARASPARADRPAAAGRTRTSRRRARAWRTRGRSG